MLYVSVSMNSCAREFHGLYLRISVKIRLSVYICKCVRVEDV